MVTTTMITTTELLVRCRGLRAEEVEEWVVRHWVEPVRQEGTLLFAEVDVARVRLIQEMRDEWRLDEEAIPVVLSLVDQIHGLRRRLRSLAAAVEAQPAPIRRQIAEAMRRFER